MLWIGRTGALWRDLPERYGPWRMVASRFYRWQKAGVWDRVLRVELQRFDGHFFALGHSHLLHDGSLVVSRTHVADRRMSPRGVVEALDVVEVGMRQLLRSPSASLHLPTPDFRARFKTATMSTE